MMISEFIERTGFEPTQEEYWEIEEQYYEYAGDKDAFCKQWVENKGPEKLQRKRILRIEDLKGQLAALTAEKEAEIAKLKKDLEKEQEWKPYVITENVAQEDYEQLIRGGARLLTEEEAKDILYDWYGFAKEKVTIINEIPQYEVNRHGRLRKVGTIDRRPAYDATDWHYIRFDCGYMSYELKDDSLRLFVK